MANKNENSSEYTTVFSREQHANDPNGAKNENTFQKRRPFAYSKNQRNKYRDTSYSSHHHLQFNQTNAYYNQNLRFHSQRQTYQRNPWTYQQYPCADLPKITPPLMSLEFPYSSDDQVSSASSNRISYGSFSQTHPTRIDSSSRTSSVDHTNENTLVRQDSQPKYYVDSFIANFADPPESISDVKPTRKQVTFEDSEKEIKSSKSIQLNPNAEIYVAKNTDHVQGQRENFPVDSKPRSSQSNYCTKQSVYYQDPSRIRYSSYPLRQQPNYHVQNHYYWPSYPMKEYQEGYYQQYSYMPMRQLYNPNAPNLQEKPSSQHSTNFIDQQTVKTNQSNSIKHEKRSKSSITNEDSSVILTPPIIILRKSNSINEGNLLVADSVLPKVTNDPEEISISANPEEITISITNEQNNEVIPEENNQTLVQSETESVTVPDMHNLNFLLNKFEVLSIRNSVNPISAFNELAQRRKFTLNYEFLSDSSSSKFLCTIVINGTSFPCSSSGDSKREAQKLSCDHVLDLLFNYASTESESPTKFTDQHDLIAQASILKFQDLNVNQLLIGRKTLAAILMVVDDEFSKATVVSIGTGNACLDESTLSYIEDGSALHDCHGEVLARRGLIRFLFEQIKQMKNNYSSIFDYDSNTNKYKLKNNITFHMYISSIPCGTASINVPSNSIRYKQGQTEGTIFPSTSSFEFSIKSCSDKICRWNILGIQGGLLMNLLTSPIYLKTITIACEPNFDREHVRNALYKRLEICTDKIPTLYHLNVPEINCPSSKSFQLERKVGKLQRNSFAWNLSRPDERELIEPLNGKLKENRLASSLSKQSFFRDFCQFVRGHQNENINLTFQTYQQAKQLDKSYTTAKSAISSGFSQSSIEDQISWLSKGDKLEQFSN